MSEFDYRDYEHTAQQLRREEVARLAAEVRCTLRRLAKRLVRRPSPALPGQRCPA